MGTRRFGTIRRLPSGRYQARYRDASGQQLSLLGTFRTKGEADRALSLVETDLARGTYVDPRGGAHTFDEWAEYWLASNPSKRPTTLARDRRVLTTHFLPSLGAMKLSAITPLDVRRAVDQMATRVAPATVRTNLGVLRAAFNAAVDADLLARSPVRGVRAPAGEMKERPMLTPRDLFRLADELPDRYRCVVLVAGVLGLRWSEVVGLRMGDIDLGKGTLTVNQTVAEVEGRLIVARTKTRAGKRTITVPGFVIEELRRHMDQHRAGAADVEPLFVGPKGAMLRRTFRARFLRPAIARAGLDPRMDFHGLRHVAASLLVEEGAHPRAMMARLGHSTQRMSMELYAHATDDLDRRIAAQLERLVHISRNAWS